jgi:hypothetical protein
MQAEAAEPRRALQHTVTELRHPPSQLAGLGRKRGGVQPSTGGVANHGGVGDQVGVAFQVGSGHLQARPQRGEPELEFARRKVVVGEQKILHWMFLPAVPPLDEALRPSTYPRAVRSG